MAESLLEGKEERHELNKLKLKREFFEHVEDFVKKSTFFPKMLKFNGKTFALMALIILHERSNILESSHWFILNYDHLLTLSIWLCLSMIIKLYMMRTMLESLVSVRPSQAKSSGKQLRGMLDSHTIELIEQFSKVEDFLRTSNS